MFNRTRLSLSLVVPLLLFCFMFLNCSVIGPKGATSPAADTITASPKISDELPGYKAVVIKISGIVSEDWIREIRPFMENPLYDAIILWIESSGGGVTDTKIVTHKLEFLKEKYNKKLFVYSERLLASGAYWVACVADEIIISPAAYTGSIGVYMVRVDAREFYKKWGLTLHFITSDSAKIRGNDASEITEEEREYWQKKVDDLYAQFFKHVWKYRQKVLMASYVILNNIDPKQTDPVAITVGAGVQFRMIANGSLYDNKSAYLFGLIDRFMYFDGLVMLMKSWRFTIYNISGDEIKDLYIEPSAKFKTFPPHH